MKEIYDNFNHQCKTGYDAEFRVSGDKSHLNIGLWCVTLSEDSRFLAACSVNNAMKEDAIATSRCEKLVNEASDKLKEALFHYAEAITDLMVHEQAQRILSYTVPKNTGCQWEKNSDPSYPCHEETISNDVYSALIRTSSGEKSWKDKTIVWTVEYWVYTHSPISNAKHAIKSCVKSVHLSQEEADKYVAGRKDFLEKHYFSEQNPVIPKELAAYYTDGGIELPIYRYEK